MAAEQEEEENHWPGFVDALSTIVMVVTFLLIILAVAIFAMSLNIAKVKVPPMDEVKSTNMEESKMMYVTELPVASPSEAGTKIKFQSADVIRIHFEASSIDMDIEVRQQLSDHFDQFGETLTGKAFEINAYFDGTNGSYSQERRIAYYRLLRARNLLMGKGVLAEDLTVFVREAPTEDRIGTVEIYGN